MSQRPAVTGSALAKAAFCYQPKRIMTRLSPKHFILVLLAVLLTAGFSLSAAQVGVMPVWITGAGMGKMADSTMKGDCKACLKDTGSKQCQPVCIAPVVAVLPQDLAVTAVPRLEQPTALPTPFLRGRGFLPDPLPPRPSA